MRPPESLFQGWDSARQTTITVPLIMNHAAFRELCDRSGMGLLEWFRAYLSSTDDVLLTQQLLWALTASYRARNPLTETQLLEILPVDSERWAKLQAELGRLIRESFFGQSLKPIALMMAEIWTTETQRLTGQPAFTGLIESD